MSEPWKIVHITRDSKDSTVMDALERASSLDDLWVVLNSEGNLLTTEAEARLITAAPEILATLKEAMDTLDSEVFNGGGDATSEAPALHAFEARARAVIAKTETSTVSSLASVPDASHTLVTVPDRHSRTCSGCGASEFDPSISQPCPTPSTLATELPGTDETPDPPEPDIEDELEEESTDHANETGHGLDEGG